MKISFDAVQPGHRGIDVLAVICHSACPVSRLVGYFRVDVERSVKEAEVSVRAVGWQRLKVQLQPQSRHDRETVAVDDDDDDATSRLKPILRPSHPVWTAKGTVYDVSGQQWEEITSGKVDLAKGSHTLGFVLEVPHWLPPTGESWLAKAHYELRASLTGTSSKWFGFFEEEASASRELLVSAHPSSGDLGKLNPLDVRLTPMGAPPSSNNSTNTEPKVTARSSNARYGGCFDLCISLGVPEQTDEKRVHVDFDVQLAQEWSVKLSEQADIIKGVDQIARLQERSPPRQEWTQGPPPEHGPGHIPASANPSRAVSPSPSQTSSDAEVKSMEQSQTFTPRQDNDDAAAAADTPTGPTKTLCIYSNISFPDEASPDADPSAKAFYPSALSMTKVSVTFRHVLSCTVRVRVDADGEGEPPSEKSYSFDAVVRLVGRDLATESLVLPPY